MKRYLLAYKIGDEIIGVDLDSWTSEQLNGNEPFRMIYSGDTMPTGYVDISSIANWDKYGSLVANDYFAYKCAIKTIAMEVGWTGLTNTEKDLCIKYYAYPDATSAVIFLMTTKGMSLQQAQGYILLEWHKHHGNITASCRQRWFYVKFIVPQYLSFDDAEDLLNTVEPLVFAYHDMGRLGINYGDKKDGIMDYIESTNAFAGQGLRENSYVLLQGTWDEFILAMKNVFVWGVYDKYENFIL
jgi:hypothetical protein